MGRVPGLVDVMHHSAELIKFCPRQRACPSAADIFCKIFKTPKEAIGFADLALNYLPYNGGRFSVFQVP